MIHPVIMCGGVGMRLWPLSRLDAPKQFHRIAGERSPTFFQATIERQRGTGFHRPLVSVHRRYETLVREQLVAIGRQADLLIEETSRRTGPAVLAAAMTLQAREPGALMAVLPSDHLIEGDLSGALLAMAEAARDGRIVLFGISPGYPETGYGYIVDDGPNADYAEARNVSHFIEKPKRAVAEDLIAGGNAYWASGISLFRADVLIAEYTRLDPETVAAVGAALAEGGGEAARIVLAAGPYGRAKAEATESVVFEHTDRTLLAPVRISWNDIGSWRALYEMADKDAAGNAVYADCVAIDTKSSYIRARDGKLVATVGVDDLVIVDTPDALLIASLDRTQDVRRVIAELEARKREDLTEHAAAPGPKERRLSEGDGYRVREIEIPVGSALPLAPATGQNRVLTVCRGSLWCEGFAENRRRWPGDSVTVPLNTAVTLRNAGDEPLVLIEMRHDHAPVVSLVREPERRRAFSVGEME